MLEVVLRGQLDDLVEAPQFRICTGISEESRNHLGLQTPSFKAASLVNGSSFISKP